jgi:putative DNA methylase
MHKGCENLKFNDIPEHALIEKGLPIKAISELAKIEGNAKRPVYALHKWWARRLSSVVRALIIGIFLPDNTSEEDFWKAYYEACDLSDFTILDTFMGGGTCLVEAKKMKAKVIGVDIDPLACFITKKEVEDYDEFHLNQEYKILLKNVEKELKQYYTTKIGDKFYEVVNFFWVYQVNCTKCNEPVFSHPHYYLAKDKKNIVVFCKHCGKVEELSSNRKRFICKSCGQTTDIYKGSFKKGVTTCTNCGSSIAVASNVKGVNSLKLFALEYINNGERFYKEADAYDISLYQKAQRDLLQLSKYSIIPGDEIPINKSGDARPQSHGYLLYKDLFNARQLLSLSILLDNVMKIEKDDIREWFLLAFSDCLASNNMLCCYAYDYKKLTPLFGIHSYTVPSRAVENNVLGTNSLGRGSFKKTFQKMKKGKDYCRNPYEVKLNDKKDRVKVFTGEQILDHVYTSAEEYYRCDGSSLILNQTSENLCNIRNDSIDIILTDPPYYDNLAYSELSAFYYVWLKDRIAFKHDNVMDKSIFVTCDESKGPEQYVQQLTRVFQQCYQKLKNNGIVVFSFHHNKVDAWISLAKSIKNSGFIVSNVLPIRSEGNSAYHSSEESIKWDSIIVLRKNNIAALTADTLSLHEMLKYCTQELKMKKCDVVSYFRSLKLKEYVNIGTDVIYQDSLERFFDTYNEAILKAFEKKEDNHATDK